MKYIFDKLRAYFVVLIFIILIIFSMPARVVEGKSEFRVISATEVKEGDHSQ